MQNSRLFSILYYLLEKGGATAPELAKRFEVSVRTIYRDVDALSGAGIPVYASAGKGGGIRLVQGCVLGKAMMTEDEQQKLLLAVRSLAAVTDSDGELLTKLGAVFGKQGQDWMRVELSPWGMAGNSSEKFDAIKYAILQKRVLEFDYTGARGTLERRRVKPALLVYKAGAWYMQGYCMQKLAYRTFKLNRMSGIAGGEAFEETLEPPPIEDPGAAVGVDIKLRFPPKLAYRVYDEFESDGILREADGSVVLTVRMPEGEWLYGYLMSFCGGVEVLEPESVRLALADRAKNAYKKYCGA